MNNIHFEKAKNFETNLGILFLLLRDINNVGNKLGTIPTTIIFLFNLATDKFLSITSDYLKTEKQENDDVIIADNGRTYTDKQKSYFEDFRNNIKRYRNKVIAHPTTTKVLLPYNNYNEMIEEFQKLINTISQENVEISPHFDWEIEEYQKMLDKILKENK